MVESIRRHSLKNLLTASSLFHGLHDDQFEYLAGKAQFIHCLKNKHIQLHTEQSDYFYVIDQGTIMLSRVTHGGDNYVIDVLNRGGIIGVTNLCHTDHDSHLIAKAIKDSKLWRIPLNSLNELVSKDNEFTQQFLNVNLESRVNQDLELEHRTIQNVSQRIGCFLLKQCIGMDKPDVTINLPYSKHTVAAKLGVRPETFSRALKKLENESGIQANGRKIHIEDIHRLKSYVCDSCSLRFPCISLQQKFQVY